jgi:50S ribosomal subunit-associated GTPase HflX
MVERAPGMSAPRIFVSARDGRGLDVLRRQIAERLADHLAASLNGTAVPTLAAQAVTSNLSA